MPGINDPLSLRVDGFFSKTTVTATHTTQLLRVSEVGEDGKGHDAWIYGVESKDTAGSILPPNDLYVTIPEESFLHLLKDLYATRGSSRERRVVLTIGFGNDGQVNSFDFGRATRVPMESGFPEPAPPSKTGT